MTAKRRPAAHRGWSAVERTMASLARALGQATGGLQAGDLQRLFQRETARAYAVLTRDHTGEREPRGALRRTFYRLRLILAGLSARLSPPRRLLFGAALVFALLALVQGRFSFGGEVVSLGGSPLYTLLSVGSLVLLLALEMMDRVLVRDEIEVARELQKALLPTSTPEVAGYRFAHSYRIANDIGGDYYGFHSLADGRLLLLAGDASGHGMAAGLLMAIADATLKVALDVGAAPVRTVALLNRALHRCGTARNFMSLFYGVLHLDSGRLEYLCAGHPFPLLRRRDGRVEELGRGSLPLGVRPEPDAVLEVSALQEGDTLVMYSDGLPEARNAAGEVFGFERVAALVHPGGTAAELHARLLGELDRFLAGEPLGDDVSVVVVERLASAPTSGDRPGAPPPPPRTPPAPSP